MVLWNARIACREKVILLLTFSVTVVIMIIAIVRVAVGADLYHVDISWMCFWSLLESDAGNDIISPSSAIDYTVQS